MPAPTSIETRAAEVAGRLRKGRGALALNTHMIAQAMRQLVLDAKHGVCYQIGRCNGSDCPVPRKVK